MIKSVVLMALLITSNQIAVGAETPAATQTKAPLRTMRYTSRSAEEAKQWQQEVRAKIAKLLNMEHFPTNPKPDFNEKQIRVVEHDTFTIKELEINSTVNRRMNILVTIPKGSDGPFPAVVCIGGHSSTLYSVYKPETIEHEYNPWDKYYKEFATLLASTGYVTITAQVSQHEVYEEGATLVGERLWDLMRCVDYVQAMKQVDKNRIGCGGLSLGGEMAMFLPAMDERIYASVSSEFLSNMDVLEDHCLCWKFPGLRELVDFADIYALTAPRPMQCQNGFREAINFFDVPAARKAIEEIRPIYVDLGQPENLHHCVHEGAHEIDLPGLYNFFEKHLQNNRLNCGSCGQFNNKL